MNSPRHQLSHPGTRAEFRGRSEATNVEKKGEELAVSSIAWSEFLCGPLTQNDETLAQILFPAPEPFLASDAHKAAELFNATRRSRSLADCQITAVALRCDARMATANESDFTPFQTHGLTLA